jgi:hypothetical protein
MKAVTVLPKFTYLLALKYKGTPRLQSSVVSVVLSVNSYKQKNRETSNILSVKNYKAKMLCLSSHTKSLPIKFV